MTVQPMGDSPSTPGPTEVQGLRVTTTTGSVIIPGLDLRVDRGSIVGVAGETGSGKTTLGLAILGWQRSGLVRAAGAVLLDGEDLGAMPEEDLRRLRGRRIAYVPQDPGMALNPAMRIRDALGEVLRAHDVRDHARQMARIGELFRQVGLPDDPGFLARFPHQLSGGQQQRVAIATGFLLDPEVVVMDEPTTGLDAATKAGVLALIHDLARRRQASVLLISHDLRMLLAASDRIIIMRDGVIVEDAPSAALPRPGMHAYTEQLLAALPDPTAHRVADHGATAGDGLSVRGITARHAGVVITDGIDLDVAQGECVALVGESGSGKTTLARCIAGFHTEYAGSVAWDGRVLPRGVRERGIADLRTIQYVFQNPYASLNPRRTVGDALAMAARTSRGVARAVAAADAERALERVGMDRSFLGAPPQTLSGGQRQRIALARALIAQPRLLVCDEVTSSLDVSVQAGIIELLMDLRRSEGLAMLFITHDLALVSSIAARTIVLQHGTIVEQGPTAQVLDQPSHAYTRMLLSHHDATQTRQSR
ncbi:MAG: ABC transporter ATP-binding protein [Chloroflexota bacterium]